MYKKSWNEQTTEERIKTIIRTLKKDYAILNTPENYKHDAFRLELGRINDNIHMLCMILSREEMKWPWPEEEK